MLLLDCGLIWQWAEIKEENQNDDDEQKKYPVTMLADATYLYFWRRNSSRDPLTQNAGNNIALKAYFHTDVEFSLRLGDL